MPVIRSTEATRHEIHGAEFIAYANTGTGSAELCAWSLRLPAEQPGLAHKISQEEVFLVTAGAPRVSIDGEAATLAPGDVAIAPAGCLLRVDNPGAQPSTLWVTTRTGLTAQLDDGSSLTPPWAQ
jgi:mannose-6-phosphate isomerase-like protein (cupin superfamily)